ncbi:MAG: ABC transporter ATP-binding protein [Planctomycetota bacterium]|nr:ABC transporter ATP-binding protein [Planctomycetota bacterium]
MATPVLTVRELRKSFATPDGERLSVIDVPSFALGAGEHLALRGTSGSGKTTFLNLIAGILQADGGQIMLCGQNLCALSEADRDRARANSLGYVFQTFNLLQGFTALENVVLGMMFGPGADYDYAAHLLERVGLKDRMDYRPRQLSVGQQQRVAVARALANRPELVLADEPTGNLDQRNAREALALVREVCRESGAALLLVSHDQDVLSQFETVREMAEINQASQVRTQKT